MHCQKADEVALERVRLVITDVDGVLTDGGVYYDEGGECFKRFHVRDGLGIRLLEECGIRVATLSGRDSPALRRRVADLGLSFSLFGVKDKADASLQLMQMAGVHADETLCVGDDTIDLPAFAVCGMSYTVADAPEYIKRAASAVLTKRGGDGAFRELADKILTAKNLSHVFSTAEGYAAVMNRMSQ